MSSDPRTEDGLAAGALIAGRYRVVDKLGEGGMGAVYRCVQEPLGREVALKVITAALTVDRGAIERFQREAKASSSFLHPNIVTVYDYGKDDASGLLFLAMELIPGTPGDKLVDQGPVPWRRAVTILRGVCAALAEAHARGVVHRDLKPANILVTATTTQQDIAKVVDFGIAKMKDGSVTLTMTGAVVGTPGYVAPELFDGKEPSSQTDLYALGVVAFEFLCGRAPFPGRTPLELIKAHILSAPPAPSSWVSEIPAALDAVVLSLLEKDPARRPQSAQAVDAALARLASDPTADRPSADAASSLASPPPAPRATAATGLGVLSVGKTATPPSSTNRSRWVLVGAAAASVAMVGIFVPLALGSDSLPVRIDAADAGAAVATESGVKIDDAGPAVAAVAAVAADDVRGTGPNGQDFDDALTFQNDAGVADVDDALRSKGMNILKVLDLPATEAPAKAVAGVAPPVDPPLPVAVAVAVVDAGAAVALRGPDDPDDDEDDDDDDDDEDEPLVLRGPKNGAKAGPGLAAHQVSVRAAATNVAGALEVEEISPVLNQALPVLSTCFFLDGPFPEDTLGSTLRTELSIDAKGRVMATRTKANKFDGRTTTCLTRALRRLTFPKKTGGSATVALVGISIIAKTAGR